MENNEQTVEVHIPVEGDQSGKPAEIVSNPHIHNYNVDKGDGRFQCECGEFVTLKKKAPAVPGSGRKCKYCENKEKYNKLVTEFIDKHSKLGAERVTIPWVEDLAMALGVVDTRINDWVIKKTPEGEDEHPELVEAMERLKMIQRLRLKQRVLGRYNPTGAIFLLKANHGMIETEKKIVAGDSTEPLLIEIVNEKAEGAHD